MAGKLFNVLYFIVDDLRPEFMAAYGQSQMLTPNVDKLAEAGTVFRNAHCQQAVCGPSRASFMTGRRPQHTQVYGNSACFRDIGVARDGSAGADWVTCPGHFKNSNFTTLGGGKTFHPNHPPNWDGDRSWGNSETPLPYFNFSYYKVNPAYKGPCPGPGEPAGKGPSHIDTWCSVDEPDENFYDYGLANDTIDRLRYAAPLWREHGTPFFIQSGFARPHAPWRVPQRFWDLYETAAIPLATHQLPPQNMPGIAWQQDGFYNATDGEVFLPNVTVPLDAAVQRLMRHAYYASVSWTDHQIGRVLGELDALGLAADTAVVLHGDHGWQLGEHNSWHKFTNFELGTRVPLIMRVPWKPAAANATADAFAELIDVFPTLAELAGARPDAALAASLDGVSLVPVLDDPSRTVLPDRGLGTRNKTLAYSQYPHTSYHDCPFFRDGACFNTPGSSDSDSSGSTTYSATVSGGGGAAVSPQAPLAAAKADWMGFRVRRRDFSFCVWLPWDANRRTTVSAWPADPTAIPPAAAGGGAMELYDHSTDNGMDFDAMDVVNLAYDAAHAATAAEMYQLAADFFNTPPPPPPPPSPPSPSPPKGKCADAGGILDKDGKVCCPKSCGACGGKGCAGLPGGKDNCCTKEVEGNGKDCSVSKPPCNVV